MADSATLLVDDVLPCCMMKKLTMVSRYIDRTGVASRSLDLPSSVFEVFLLLPDKEQSGMLLPENYEDLL